MQKLMPTIVLKVNFINRAVLYDNISYSKVTTMSSYFSTKATLSMNCLRIILEKRARLLVTSTNLYSTHQRAEKVTQVSKTTRESRGTTMTKRKDSRNSKDKGQKTADNIREAGHPRKGFFRQG